MEADVEGRPYAYRLFLPVDGIAFGDGPSDYVVGIAEGSLASDCGGGAIDIATRVLDVAWDTSEAAWRAACTWFKTESRLRQDDGETWEELRARGNPRGFGFAGPFDVEPGDAPMA
ncbi:hypothetical protein [Clavibacter michiganensis]|uniref:hypothetical protein n=1 Tax=Clavibacter michiganensis TaxID=28447 RepID=UPI001269D0DB|nr:hypothetical protein [Clavibacter michiganensis]